MPIAQTKGITVKIDAALHAEIKAYLEQNEMTMSEFIALAFQVSEETFQRLKDYLKRHKVKQRAFVVGLVEAALEKDEAAQGQKEDVENEPD